MALPAAQQGRPSAAPPRSDILIVDKNEIVRGIMRTVIEREGYSVAVASNGKEAVEYLTNHSPPSLILLDVILPVMNGHEFLAWREQLPHMKAIPLAIISADLSAPDAARKYSAEYLPKPFQVQRIRELVARYRMK
jgi:CheY-like chemotaxis protein